MLNGKKEYVPKHVMIMPPGEAHEIYKAQNKNEKIGLSSFKKSKQVKRITETSRKSC